MSSRTSTLSSVPQSTISGPTRNTQNSQRARLAATETEMNNYRHRGQTPFGSVVDDRRNPEPFAPRGPSLTPSSPPFNPFRDVRPEDLRDSSETPTPRETPVPETPIRQSPAGSTPRQTPFEDFLPEENPRQYNRAPGGAAPGGDPD